MPYQLPSYILAPVSTAAFCVLAIWIAERAKIKAALLQPATVFIVTAGTILQVYALHRFTGWNAAALSIAISAAVVSAATDAATGYVFDVVTLPGLTAVLAACMVSHSLVFALEGAAACSGTLLLLYLVTRGRGVGLGDAKLACCVGAALGGPHSLFALGAAFVSGGAYAAILLLSRKAACGETLRFAPYMTAGMFAAIFFEMRT